MRVHLGGHLAYYHSQKQSWFEHNLAGAAPLSEVLKQLGIPAAEIALAIVNNELVDIETAVVSDQDTVQFYAPNDGG
jgi:sulfur carrier protein ThiS